MDPFKPTPSLLMKLGSIVVHADAATSEKGHPFDIEAIKSLLSDAEVVEWMKEMDKRALLPVRR